MVGPVPTSSTWTPVARSFVDSRFLHEMLYDCSLRGPVTSRLCAIQAGLYYAFTSILGGGSYGTNKDRWLGSVFGGVRANPDVDVFGPLVDLTRDVFASGGIYFYQGDTGDWGIRVPFSPETMPDES